MPFLSGEPKNETNNSSGRGMLHRLPLAVLHGILDFADASLNPICRERCGVVNRLRLLCKATEESLRKYPCFALRDRSCTPVDKGHLCRGLCVETSPLYVPDHVEAAWLETSELHTLPAEHPKLRRLALWLDVDASLPKYITHLSAGLHAAEDFRMLPTSLTYVNVTVDRGRLVAEMLPATLVTLKLSGTSEFSVSSVPGSIRHLWLESCSMTLTEFPDQLFSCELSRVSCHSWPSLPSSLRRLEMDGDHHMSMLLPPDVRILKVESPARPLLSWFPPGLRVLVLPCRALPWDPAVANDPLSSEYTKKVWIQCPRLRRFVYRDRSNCEVRELRDG